MRKSRKGFSFKHGKKKITKEKPKRFMLTWGMILAGIGALIVAISPNLFDFLLKRSDFPPVFGVKNFIRNPNLPIEIFAKNKTAQKKQNLDVKWDGFVLNDAAVFIPSENSFTWKFSIKN